jgi:hypothetical protein
VDLEANRANSAKLPASLNCYKISTMPSLNVSRASLARWGRMGNSSGELDTTKSNNNSEGFSGFLKVTSREID